jgi:hypothetical protein
MPPHDVALKGSGRVELAAYGVADAEHQVEKEVRAAWPEARVEVLEVSRAGAQGRIVEEFAVRYRVRGTVTVEVEDAKEARRTALRELRGRLAGTRHARIAWDPE